ncbi:hypothetical protein J2S43_002486 [Catenuloplanes nepalensis]|uniref:Uncharacterized protein n=1 Tax=Catenuloplanes nepalensis TaxID=587533 RepID=A0ABT9MRB7_9ACTN|nr:hypothetical protein [Catenuloplanes nepalensis]MDP9793974.1 hypothetical protein [Catenuloplanes nepalensis]
MTQPDPAPQAPPTPPAPKPPDTTGTDAYISNDDKPDSQYAGGVFDTDPASVLPFGEAVKNTVSGIPAGINEGDWSDLYSAAADLGGNALSFYLDPLNWLISAGLTFLIDFVQPLEDLLSLFTGNAERIEPYAKKWEELGTALVPLAAAARQAADDDLIEWQGRDADAAKARLHQFADAVEATGGEASSINGILTLFSKIMGAAQQIIIGIIATLIEWMIIEWGLAMAAAVPTAGASVAAAGVATGVQATVATSRAVRIVDKVVSLLHKMGAVLQKVLPAVLKARVGESVLEFTRRGIGAAAPATLSTVARIAGDVLGDPASYGGPVVNNTATGVWKNAAADKPDMSEEEIEAALDVNK